MVSTVYIAKTVYGGDGLGRLGDGRAVFVPGAFAGEQVKAEIVESKKHFVRARLVEIVDRCAGRTGEGPVRIPGMVYDHLTYEAERATKEDQLREFFSRARLPVGKIENPWHADDPLAYRNKAVYQFERRGRTCVIGYRSEPSHTLVDVPSDPLVVPAIAAALPEIRASVRTLLTQGAEAVRRRVEGEGRLTVRWTRRSGVKWWTGAAPDDLVLKETTMGRVFETPSDGFYQVNPEAGERLVESVVAAYRDGWREAPDVLDLYCGVGVFGLCCIGALRDAGLSLDGGRMPRLTGVESGRRAIAFAKRNAAAQGVDARFYASETSRAFDRLRVSPRTTIVVDPPRSGLEKGVAEWLAQSPASRIFYVSCDPATLMRDLRVLTRTYEVAAVRWFDLFPRTARFETFVALSRRGR